MIVLLPGSIRVLHDLAEFDDLVVRAQYVEVTDAVAPEGVDVLDGAFREVQAELLRLAKGRLDIRGIQRRSG